MTILSKKKQIEKRENEKDTTVHQIRSVRIDSVNTRVNRNNVSAPPISTLSSNNIWNSNHMDELNRVSKNELNETSGAEFQTAQSAKRKINGTNSPHRSIRCRPSNIQSSAASSSMPQIQELNSNKISGDEGKINANNSEDEYEKFDTQKYGNVFKNAESLTELESTFRKTIKEKKGFIIKPIKEDGACLFRAVADQIYGDEEMHSIARNHCMDYIAKNADYFKQYITEDINDYVSRKRVDTCYGNHIEIIALAEIYNRPIEVYEYNTDPSNTFQSVFQSDNEPIRLSYHGRNHYNSLVDPYKATIGVGLGLPSFCPGLAEKTLLNDAIKTSEEFHIEKQMLDDKLKATDWEATNEEIMELVARESYLQWLKDNEKRQNTQIFSNTISSPSAMATCSSWDPTNSNINSTCVNQPLSSCYLFEKDANNELKYHAKNPENNSVQSGKQIALSQSSKKNLQSSKLICNQSSANTDHKSPNRNEQNSRLHVNDFNRSLKMIDDENEVSKICDDKYIGKLKNKLQCDFYGGCTENDEDEILAQVLSVSQQEYLESLKKNKDKEKHGYDDIEIRIKNNETNEISTSYDHRFDKSSHASFSKHPNKKSQ